MKFDQPGWVNDMAAGTVAGLLCAAVAILITPHAPHEFTVLTGGIGGFITGAVNVPLRWLLDLRRRANDKED